MLVLVTPLTTFCSRAPTAPPRPHARATHARDVIGERKGRISAKLGEQGGVERSPPRDCLYPRDCCPFFSTYELQWLRFLSVGTTCFTSGERRGSQGHRSGEAWLGPDRIGGEMIASAASHVLVACARLTAKQQRDAVCTLAPYVTFFFACGITQYVLEV